VWRHLGAGSDKPAPTLNPQVLGSSPRGRTERVKVQLRGINRRTVTLSVALSPNGKPNTVWNGGRERAGQRDVWELRASAGRDAGRVRRRYSTFHGTKREAERALARLVAESERHRTTDQPATLCQRGSKTAINDVLAGWRDNGWDDLSPTTVWPGRCRGHSQGRRKRRIATVRVVEKEPNYFEETVDSPRCPLFRNVLAHVVRPQAVRFVTPVRTTPGDAWPAQTAAA
jgi:hypothetical protein